MTLRGTDVEFAKVTAQEAVRLALICLPYAKNPLLPLMLGSGFFLGSYQCRVDGIFSARGLHVVGYGRIECCPSSVVLKLSSSSVGSVSREAEILQRLQRVDGVIKLIHSGNLISNSEIIGFGFAAAPMGVTLDDAISMCPSLDLLSCALMLASVLRQIHDLGVIHGDIKPSNVILDTFGTPCFIDFGSARFLSDTPMDDVEFTRKYASQRLLGALSEGAEVAPSQEDDLESLCLTLWSLQQQVAGRDRFQVDRPLPLDLYANALIQATVRRYNQGSGSHPKRSRVRTTSKSKHRASP